jgi:hypothetical protein
MVTLFVAEVLISQQWLALNAWSACLRLSGCSVLLQAAWYVV